MDTPKGFFRLLKYKEMSIKKQKEKKEAKENADVKKKVFFSIHFPILDTQLSYRKKKIFVFNQEKDLEILWIELNMNTKVMLYQLRKQPSQ